MLCYASFSFHSLRQGFSILYSFQIFFLSIWKTNKCQCMCVKQKVYVCWLLLLFFEKIRMNKQRMEKISFVFFVVVVVWCRVLSVSFVNESVGFVWYLLKWWVQCNQTIFFRTNIFETSPNAMKMPRVMYFIFILKKSFEWIFTFIFLCVFAGCFTLLKIFCWIWNCNKNLLLFVDQN